MGDNGMRLSCAYFLNPHWEPADECCGGLDCFLTDPSKAPASADVAKKAPRLRIAPHADTLAIFLSERIAHQVIATRSKEQRCFVLTLWGLSGAAMQEMTKKM